MNPFVTEAILHWCAVALYIVSTALFAHAVLFDHPSRLRWAIWASVIGLLPHSTALLLRWISTGHGPYMLKYEVLSSNAWIAVGLLLLFVFIVNYTGSR